MSRFSALDLFVESLKKELNDPFLVRTTSALLGMADLYGTYRSSRWRGLHLIDSFTFVLTSIPSFNITTKRKRMV